MTRQLGRFYDVFREFRSVLHKHEKSTASTPAQADVNEAHFV